MLWSENDSSWDGIKREAYQVPLTLVALMECRSQKYPIRNLHRPVFFASLFFVNEGFSSQRTTAQSTPGKPFFEKIFFGIFNQNDFAVEPTESSYDRPPQLGTNHFFKQFILTKF